MKGGASRVSTREDEHVESSGPSSALQLDLWPPQEVSAPQGAGLPAGVQGGAQCLISSGVAHCEQG